MRLLPAALLLLAGCEGGSSGDEGVTTTVDTVAGVVHVHHAGRAPVAELEPVLSVGEVGGAAGDPSPAEFGRVRSVVADGDGRVFVADGQALEIRVFGPDGAFQRRLGREGGGPGEIGGLHGAVWLGEDTLLVVDYGNARLMRLTADGEHLDQWGWIPITGPNRFHHALGPREIYARGLERGEDGRSRAVWVRYTPDGPADTLAVPVDDAASASTVTCRGQGIGFFGNPFADRLVTSPAPGARRVVARSSAYRLAFLDAAGDTVRVLSRELAPVPLPDSTWQRVEEEYREFRDRWAGASCDGSISRPPHLPRVEGVFFDHEGRLLVEHRTPTGRALDVFDGDGGWLATIPVPERDRSVAPHLRDDRLYLVSRDELGVQRVEGFRLDGYLPRP